ncbi:hypothetical protein ACF0H5_009984 [Mactra antiquata]
MMEEGDAQRYASSPRKMSHLHVIRKMSRTGDDSFDTDEYANECYNFQDRRCSNQSMSRFNSCPQLADQDSEIRIESFERTADDINTSSNKLSHEQQLSFIKGSSPLMRKKVFQENGQISDTPTPPSTPKSRRSCYSSHDSLLTSPEKTSMTSPFTSPRLLLRKQLKQSALSRDSSVDSFTDKSLDEPALPLSVENLNKFVEIKESDESLKSPKEESIKMSRRKSRKSITPEVTDTVNKCENWLQTLQIAQTDRVKSRSNIQLPPI